MHSYFTCVKQDLSHHTMIFTWGHWPWSLTYFSKPLTLFIVYEPYEIGFSYFTCIFFVTRPFTPYHKFWSCDLDLELWITYTKCCYSYWVASRRTSLSSDNSCSYNYNVLNDVCPLLHLYNMLRHITKQSSRGTGNLLQISLTRNV